MNAPAASLSANTLSSTVSFRKLGRHMVGSPRHLGLAFGLVAAHAVAVFAGLVSFAVVGELDNPFRAGWTTLAMVGLVTLVTAGGVIGLGVVKAGGASLAQLGWKRDRVGRDVAVGLLAAPAAMGLVVGIASLLGLTTPHEMASTIAGFSTLDRVAFACIGLSAAFTEESLFRGYLQPGLTARFGTPLAIVACAAVFSVYHLDFRIHSLIIKFALGVLFSILRERTGSLVPSAIAHGSVWVVIGAA